MLSLVLAESALELIPHDLRNHKSVIASAHRLSKKSSEILLDVSWHFAAMKGIKNEIKRGRPDLIHFCLLEACSIPLFFKNQLQVFVHTIDDKVIFFGEGIRLPKSYHRFAGLIEKLYFDKVIKENGKKLLEIRDMSFEQLIQSIKPAQVIGLSQHGTSSSYQEVAEEIRKDSCIVVGGFSKGQFSDRIKKLCTKIMSVELEPLEAHIIISRLLYEYEKRIIT